MKKLLSGIFILACGATWIQADELKFVTELSQPIGAFANVESINQKRPSETFFVNFCNTGVNTGKIEAKGLVKWKRLTARIRLAQINEGCADKRLAVRINTCGTDKHLRGFLSAIKCPRFRAFPPHKKPRR